MPPTTNDHRKSSSPMLYCEMDKHHAIRKFLRASLTNFNVKVVSSTRTRTFSGARCWSTLPDGSISTRAGRIP